MEKTQRIKIAKEMVLLGRKRTWFTALNCFLLGVAIGVVVDEGVIHIVSEYTEVHSEVPCDKLDKIPNYL